MLSPHVPSSWLPLPGAISEVKEDEHLSHIHPLILQCMAPCHQVFKGKINLGNILTGANIEMKDLPTLEGLTDSNGRSTFFLHFCLSICSYAKKGKCKFIRGHMEKDKIMQTFASKLCQVIAPGVQHMLTHGSTGKGLPQKKQKGSG